MYHVPFFANRTFLRAEPDIEEDGTLELVEHPRSPVTAHRDGARVHRQHCKRNKSLTFDFCGLPTGCDNA